MADGPEIIDKTTRIELMQLVGEAKTRERMYLDAVVSAANMAAFQVLDKRIEWLEAKDDKNVSDDVIGLRDFFLDVLIDIAIGHVASSVLQQGLESLLRPILVSRQAYYELPKNLKKVSLKKAGVTKIGFSLNEEKLKDAKKRAKQRISNHLTSVANEEALQAYKIIPEVLVGAATNVASDDARGSINLANRGSKKGNGKRKGDVAIVRILASVDDSIATQRAAVDAMYTSLEAHINHADIPVPIGKLLAFFLEANRSLKGSTATGRKQTRNHLLLWYEAAMWAHMVKSKKAITEKGPSYTSGGGNTAKSTRQEFANPEKYEVLESGKRRVIFRAPDGVPASEGGGYGVVNKKYIVALPEEWLEYWISRFPRQFSDIDGLTHRDAAEKQVGDYGANLGKKRTESAIQARAYRSTLRMFEHINYQLEDRYPHWKRRLNP